MIKDSYTDNMTRILICYYSKSGTTQKMAEKIAEGVEDSEREIVLDVMSVEEADVKDLPNYDGVIFGSPTYYGLPAAQIKEFIDESIMHHGKLEGMVGGVFTSSANPAGGNETTLIALIEALLIHGMIVKGMSKGDHYGPVVAGDPDEREMKQCKYYGKVMAELTDEITKIDLG